MRVTYDLRTDGAIERHCGLSRHLVYDGQYGPDRRRVLLDELDRGLDYLDTLDPHLPSHEALGSLLRPSREEKDANCPNLRHVGHSQTSARGPWSTISLRARRVREHRFIQVFFRDCLIGEIRDVSNPHGAMYRTPLRDTVLESWSAVEITIQAAQRLAIKREEMRA